MSDQSKVPAGIPASEHVFMVGSAAEMSRLIAALIEKKERVAAWDELPQGRSPSSITALRLYDNDARRKKLPKLVKKLDHLEYLSIPAHLVAELTAEIVPPSIRTLIVETTPPATFATGLVLPNVVRVEAHGPVFFGEDTFPALQDLSIRFDRKQKMLPIVGRFPHLVGLGMGPVSDESAFAAIAGLSALSFLGISGGHLPTLDGIEQLSALTELRLHLLPKLADVSALGALARLESLSFLYCPHLEKLDTLLQLPRLRQLEFVGCADQSGALATIQPRLNALGLAKFTIS